jgi:hypothetical protein
MRNFKTSASGWYCDPIWRMAIVAVDVAHGSESPFQRLIEAIHPIAR